MRVQASWWLSLMMSLVVPVMLSSSAAWAGSATVGERFPPPPGFTRVATDVGSFGRYLQSLSLLPPGSPVRAFHGGAVAAPWAEAVVDLDVGSRDLQQCADTAIRLYAEYQRARGATQTLSFHATSGDPLPWSRYRAGERAVATGRRLSWQRVGAVVGVVGVVGDDDDIDEAVWRSWLDAVFTYAGSMSLVMDTIAVGGAVRPGDLLVVGGSPGHVLVVLDVATASGGTADGHERWLLGQGFMPAQSFHVLGWYAPDDAGAITVPSWPRPFERTSRRRFR
jgi:hypothetical protein